MKTGANPHILEYVSKSSGLKFTAEMFFGKEFLDILEELFVTEGEYSNEYKYEIIRKLLTVLVDLYQRMIHFMI